MAIGPAKRWCSPVQVEPLSELELADGSGLKMTTDAGFGFEPTVTQSINVIEPIPKSFHHALRK